MLDIKDLRDFGAIAGSVIGDWVAGIEPRRRIKIQNQLSGAEHVPKHILIASWTEYKRFRTGLAHAKIASFISRFQKILKIR